MGGSPWGPNGQGWGKVVCLAPWGGAGMGKGNNQRGKDEDPILWLHPAPLPSLVLSIWGGTKQPYFCTNPRTGTVKYWLCWSVQYTLP